MLRHNAAFAHPPFSVAPHLPDVPHPTVTVDQGAGPRPLQEPHPRALIIPIGQRVGRKALFEKGNRFNMGEISQVRM